MPVRGSLASLAMATTGCAPGHLKDANGVCRLVYVPEVLSPPTQMPPDDQRYEDQYQKEPWMEQMPPPPPAPPPIDPGEFFPIDVPPTEPLVSYFRPGIGTGWGEWDLSPISKYNMDYNDSQRSGGANDSQSGQRYLAPPGKIPDYMYANPHLNLPENPWPEYADAEGYAEEAIQPFSRGPDGITPVWSWKTGSDGLLTGGSGGITTPLPSIPSPSPMPMPMPIPDNSLPAPIEEYNSSPHGAGSSDQFESYLQHFPPGTYTHEGALQDFLGRPPNAQELYMLDLNNNQFNMPVIDPGDNQYNMPNVDPYNWELPPNNDGLLGIVGGGLVDQPIWDA